MRSQTVSVEDRLNFEETLALELLCTASLRVIENPGPDVPEFCSCFCCLPFCETHKGRQFYRRLAFHHVKQKEWTAFCISDTWKQCKKVEDDYIRPDAYIFLSTVTFPSQALDLLTSVSFSWDGSGFSYLNEFRSCAAPFFESPKLEEDTLICISVL